MIVVGIDIGGTKCAVSLGDVTDATYEIFVKMPVRQTRDYTVQGMLEQCVKDIQSCIAERPDSPPVAVGISCGGPLDSRHGLILSPPNLPGWDSVPIRDFIASRTGLPTWLCNDANAGALAEWHYGAGKGCDSMVFLTFGTGLGAGLILDGRLYVGANDMAGEVGHIRLAPTGPPGYGKKGSFEGFCSGGGIALQAQAHAREWLAEGKKTLLCTDESTITAISARTVGEAAQQGDPLAVSIMTTVGRKLGLGLSVIMDILNPERIIIGGIFQRSYDYIWPEASRVLAAESLALNAEACTVMPAALKENIGDVSALISAYYHSKKEWQ
ncbi:ROK family protein [Parasphaerochaeta coccoides]|uniref:Glucokinase n=1 Tax=Parasphaerochaeta coccoides (strain ATCC BAA-1237 / DSM 17374 / SPN1) TaxID=760011 RepID=F4GJS4_PARC1|nr:ROK family protein [Parasphaerochaeta coccoides]AEC02821.1 Glucokinase [Parasphaerochaeta coccoides DSM 17374]